MKKLFVVWKSNNETDIHNFIVPYAFNSKKHEWFTDVEVLIWGASQEKVADDLEIQEKIKSLIGIGINVYACKFCADKVNATKTLESIGVEVIYTGVLLSDRQKDDVYEVITI